MKAETVKVRGLYTLFTVCGSILKAGQDEHEMTMTLWNLNYQSDRGCEAQHGLDIRLTQTCQAIARPPLG
ncbi:hypothetical protein E2C01_045852 [Portunus trituberculatus]|uniref:Uncharacterized protein n=1 Tax=Portunus trituberculatus TaxID=210409 RepID=A0A5B7G3G5_PORTR|nr:hypothetical protein [Portunus trituberculatus]